MNDTFFLGKKVFFEENIFDCLVVGSGASAYNAALHLYGKDVTQIAIITENRYGGTSRNTGSDKQTYYKIACAGDQADSPRAMAQTLFSGGSMDGDIALCEAGHSLQEFFHLVSIGVDFPHNRYGEYAGYKTDHDPLQRASSIGPYTSKKMTEKLEAEVLRRNINIINRCRVVKLLLTSETEAMPADKAPAILSGRVDEANAISADSGKRRAYGLLVLENRETFRTYFAKNIIFATGGNPGIYLNTVYPASQFGASGILAREGIRFANMTEWQYGIASVKFRWNLSGSYQQVIPRYISVDDNGNEEEFLSSYFSSPKNVQRAVFLKGYQWPFDPGKLAGEGSSLVDLAIYIEKHIKGKRIFLDYTRNPAGMFPDDFDKTAHEYLSNSNALQASPVERLKNLNPLSYELYLSHNIDLAKETLEIDVVPQHHNGGVEVDLWWETSAKHLFAIGECAGTHGVHRPGGSALNSGQVGAYRVACHIAAVMEKDPFFPIDYIHSMAKAAIEKFKDEFGNVIDQQAENDIPGNFQNVEDTLVRLQKMNSRCAAFIRSKDEIEKNLAAIESISNETLEMPQNITDLFKLKEIQAMSRLLYNAIETFIKEGGKSRGSYLIIDSIKNIEKCLSGVETDTEFRDKILISSFTSEKQSVVSAFRQVRPIPESDTWFEQVWHDYRNGAVHR